MLDSHAHVLDPQFDADRDAVFTRAAAAGVQGWIEIGTTVAESVAAVQFAREHENVWATVGVHPDHVTDLAESDWEQLQALLKTNDDKKIVAVGEVGFDFYRGGTRESQQPALERFIELARTHQLPLVFHVRDPAEPPAGGRGARPKKGASAHEALLNLLEQLPASQRPQGVIHTYSGTAEQSQRYLALGLYLSFSGVITFTNKTIAALRDVARTVPLERLLVETDCPYLAPYPHRGERNEPSYVRIVAEKIAELRAVPLETITDATATNTHTLFSLGKT